MSQWQGFADDLVSGGHLYAGAIFNQDGTLFAASSNFPQFKEDDIKAIMNGFNNPGSLFQSGLVFGDTKYSVTRADPSSIHGKKGSGGIVIRKTKTVLIIGIYDANIISPAVADQVVEKLGDYLEENDY